MLRAFMWQLPVRLHVVHHGVVLQGQALLHWERWVSIHLCQSGNSVTVPDESMRTRLHPDRVLIAILGKPLANMFCDMPCISACTHVALYAYHT